MASIIKQEINIDPVDLEVSLLELCAQYSDGISEPELRQRLPNVDPQQRAAALNSLLTKAKIDLLKSGNILHYKLRNQEANVKIEGSDREEKLIYQIVEESGNVGIWVRDIRARSNLPQAQLNKILRSLETKKLIKAVKTVGAVRKKVYMLFELKPDITVSGGTFYADQEFDSEFAGLLAQQCEKYLRIKAERCNSFNTENLNNDGKHGVVDVSEMLLYIKQLKISNVELEQKDIEMILNCLVYDGCAEKCFDVVSQQMLYKASKPLLPSAGLTRIPCCNCPLMQDCRPGGIISPVTCLYMEEWLNS